MASSAIFVGIQLAHLVCNWAASKCDKRGGVVADHSQPLGRLQADKC